MKSRLLEYGVEVTAHPGERDTGDQYLVKSWRNGALVGVVDGLGHGAEAAEVARRAIHTLDEHPSEPVIALLTRCHAGLQGTRGAVVSLASFNATNDTMTWLGVGNVEGLLLRSDPRINPKRETLLLRGGVAGSELPSLRASVLPVSRGDTLVLATDGVGNGFAELIHPAEPPQDAARRIMERCAKGNDDALVLVARYMGRSR